MATPISHFVSFEVSLIDMSRGVRFLAAVGHRASVTVFRMKAIIHVAAEGAWSMKPRTSTDEDTSSKPFWAVVARWSTAIRRDVVVAIRTVWCYSDVDAHLSFCPWGDHREATSSNGS
jgi:hypothetical protein